MDMPTSNVEIFYGSDIPTLEGFLCNRIREHKQSDIFKPVVIVCGSNIIADYLRIRLINYLSAIVNVHIYTISSLTKQLNYLSDFSSRISLPNGLKTAQIIRILKSINLNIFDEVKDLPGFQLAFKYVLDDIDEAGIDESIVKQYNLDKGYLGEKNWREVLLIWRSLQKLIPPFRNEIDDLLYAGNKGFEFKNYFGCDRLIVYGFYDFNAVQEDFFFNLSKDINLEFIVPAYPTTDIYGSAFDFVNVRLTRWENRFNKKAQLIDIYEDSKHIDFAKRLFRYAPITKPVDLSKHNFNIEIISCQSPLDEVRAVVGRIQSLLIKEQVPLNRIAIVMWNYKLYSTLFKENLLKAEIPFCEAIPKPFAQTKIGQTVLKFLSFSPKALSSKKLRDFLAEYPLKLSEFRIEPDLVEWELIIIQTGIIEGDKTEWIKALDKLSEEQQSEYLDKEKERINLGQLECFKEFLLCLFGYLESLSNKPNYLKIIEIISYLAERWLPDCDDKTILINSFKGVSKDINFSDVFDFEDIGTIVLSYLNELRLPSEIWREGVLLATPASARGLTFEYLFLPGFAQSWVPSSISESSILDDNERVLINRILSKTDFYPLPVKEERKQEERLLFAILTNAAEKMVIFSFPKYELGGGEPVIPSRYLMEFCRVWIGASLEIDALYQLPFFYDESRLEDRFWPEISLSEYDYISGWLNKHNIGELSDKLIADILSDRYSKVIYPQSVYNARRDRTKFTIWDGVSDYHQPFQAYKDILTVNVSEIEEWAKCPFRSLVSRRLGLVELEEPEARLTIESHIIGLLIHRALARLFRIAESKFNPLDKIHLDESSKIMGQILEELYIWALRRWPAPIGIWNAVFFAIRQRIMGCLNHMVETEDINVESKVEFSVEAQYELEIENVPNLRLQGRIDRLDITKDGKSIRVIDYKTGKVSVRDNNIESGTSIQLPFYMKMIFDSNPKIDPKSSVGELLVIDSDGKVNKVKFEGSEVINQNDSLKQILYGFIWSRLKSIYPPLPINEEVCKSCPVERVCDKKGRRFAQFKCEKDNRVDILLSIRGNSNVKR